MQIPATPFKAKSTILISLNERIYRTQKKPVIIIVAPFK